MGRHSIEAHYGVKERLQQKLNSSSRVNIEDMEIEAWRGGENRMKS